MEKQVAQIVLNDYLECPICLEFAVSPVHSCGNGHILCGICVDKTNACSTCQGAMSNLSPTPLIDRILRSEGVMLPCRNQTHGCTLEVKPQEMKNHLAISCDFRPIKCTEVGCDGQSYAPRDLFDHWVNTHHIYHEAVESGGPPTLEQRSDDGDMVLGVVDRPLDLEESVYKRQMMLPPTDADYGLALWASSYFELDGQTFVIHVRGQGEMVHSWITLLGPESVACKYKYVGSLTSKNYKATENRKHNKILFHERPVHCLQYADFDKIKTSEHTMPVRYKTLQMLIDSKGPTDAVNVFEWRVQFQILKGNNSVTQPSYLTSITNRLSRIFRSQP